MTLTVEPPAAVGYVVMTRDEALSCVARIKANLEDVRALLFDLKERDGWRALGYQTWRECITHEFHMSRSRAHQLVNAHMVDRILAGQDEPGVHNVDISEQIPEAHARELAPIIQEPEAVRQIVAEVRDEKGDAATAAHVREKVDRHLARPARQSKASTPTVRRTSEDSQEISDDAAFGFVDAPTHDDPPADPYDHADPFDGLTPHPDGISAPVAADDLALTDRPGAASSDAPPSSPDDAETDLATPSAPPASFTAAPKTSSVSAGAGSKNHAPTRTFSARPLDAGDLTRALFDFTTTTVVAAMGETLSDQERGSLAAQLIDGLPAHEVERLSHRIGVRVRSDAAPSLKSIKADLRKLSTSDLLALERELPMIRKEIGQAERAAQKAAS